VKRDGAESSEHHQGLLDPLAAIHQKKSGPKDFPLPRIHFKVQLCSAHIRERIALASGSF
jgi:hypothetical protein